MERSSENVGVHFEVELAIVLPEVPGSPPRGTFGGSVFFVAGGRPLLRNRPTPVDPATSRQRRHREAWSASGKTFAYQLSAAQRGVWNTFSRFAANGQDEITATTIASLPTGAGFPFARTADAIPAPPAFVAITYQTGPFALRTQVSSPLGPAGVRIVLSATSPSAATSSPGSADLVVIASKMLSPGMQTWSGDYVNRLGRAPRPGQALLLDLRLYVESIPSFSGALRASISDSSGNSAARMVQPNSPLALFGNVSFRFFAEFSALAIGAPLTLTVDPGDLLFFPPPNILNGVDAFAVLTDAVGVKRESTLRLTWDGGGGSQTSLSMPVVVGF